jgi:hypothetical protein
LSPEPEPADPLPEDSDGDEDEDDEDDVLAAVSEADPFDPLAADSFPAATVLEPLRLSVR